MDTYKSLEQQMCSANETYFIDNYFHAVNPFDGLSLLLLDPKQHKILKRIYHSTFIIDSIEERQIGTSTMLAAHALWLALFYPDQQILIMNKDNRKAAEMRALVRTAYKQLPNFLKFDTVADNASTLKFNNGSWIRFTNSNPNNLRGFNLNYILLDDFEQVKPAYQKELRQYCERRQLFTAELLHV